MPAVPKKNSSKKAQGGQPLRLRDAAPMQVDGMVTVNVRLVSPCSVIPTFVISVKPV